MARNNLSRKLKATAEVKSYAVQLPTAVSDVYESQAAELEVDTGSLLAERLANTQNYTADKPIYFSDEQRQELEKLLESNFKDANEVIEKVRRVFTVARIFAGDRKPVDITLNPTQIMRIEGRCFHGTLFEQKVNEFVQFGINSQTGLA